MSREFRRALRRELHTLERDGWVMVAVERFAGGTEESFLMERPTVTPGWVSVEGLGPDETRVVLRVVERLRKGFRDYGALDIAGNPKNWRAEATEEFLDGAIYMAMESIRQEKG